MSKSTMNKIVSEFAQPNKKNEFHNPSGIQPVEYKCLVKPYHIEDTDEVLKSAKEAGIVLATDQKDREQMTQCIALLVAVGGNAFEDWKREVPKPGDRVLMAKYCGVRSDGIDGFVYRTISDKDIAAILFNPRMKMAKYREGKGHPGKRGASVKGRKTLSEPEVLRLKSSSQRVNISRKKGGD